MKQFDLLEMILQAHEYEELEGTPGRLQEFFDSTNGESSSPPFHSGFFFTGSPHLCLPFRGPASPFQSLRTHIYIYIYDGLSSFVF